MKRRLIDRILDFVWVKSCPVLTRHSRGLESSGPGGGLSVSGTMAWPGICASLAQGGRDSACFRRESSVREVVETLGPGDARCHARRIRETAPELLTDPRVRAVDAWGDPIRWPGFLLGTPGWFSPTTLRYLAHALWLRNNGLVEPGGTILEIGVGFGGLAAMNAIVSGAYTLLADLPPVTAAAMKMLKETGLADFARPADENAPTGSYCVVSNYAFSELNRDLQDDYLNRYLKGSRSGMIVSNANVFARSIGGRNDDELETSFKEAGLPSTRSRPDLPSGPTDLLVGVNIHVWNNPDK